MFTSRVINASASLIYLAAMTRSLSLEAFGTFSIIIATAQLVYGVLDFNTWQIMVQYGTPHKVRGDTAALSRLTLFCMMLEIGSACIGIIAILLLFPLVRDKMEWAGPLGQAALIFILFFQLCFRSTAVGLLRIGEHFREGAIAETTMPILRLFGAIGVAVFSPSLIHFLIIWAIAEAAIAVSHWYFALQRSALHLFQNPFSAARMVLSEEAGIWRFAWITNLGVILSTANQQIVMLLTGFWLGPVAAGLFRIGHQLGQAMARLVEIISRTLFTEFNRLQATQQASEVMALLRRTNRIALIGGALLVMSLILSGKWLIIVLAGGAYAGAYYIVIIMAFAAVLELICATYQAALTSKGHAGAVLLVRLSSTLFLMASLYPLIQHFTINAPAMAILVSTAVAYIAFRVGLKRAL